MTAESETSPHTPLPEPSARLPLHTRILLGLLVGGLLGGGLNAALGGSTLLEPVIRHLTEPLGTLFMRLLIMLVVPLVFSSLTLGVAGIGDVRRLGKMGARAFGYTFVISAISVGIGLGVANGLEPGRRLEPAVSQALQEKYSAEAAKKVSSAPGKDQTDEAPLMAVVKTLVPQNPLASAARESPDMLGLMFFSVLLGIALTLIGARAAPVLAVLDGIFAATNQLIAMTMRLAPYAVFCLLFTMTARFGFGLLLSLGWFVGTVLLGLGLHMFVTYPLALRFFSDISPVAFFRRVRTVMITAFSTSSSNATLPTALRVSEEQLGVPRDINAFVLTVGATANQNGTALFEGVTVLFLAQLAGVDLSLGQQVLVAYLAILGGIGTAGVPSGSIPFIIVVLGTVGVNPALIAIILGVDRLLDMCRTVLNVVGDLTVATYVAHAEGVKLLPENPPTSAPLI